MNVLFLTHRLPYAPNRGDRIRAYYLLREMARFADVSVFSLLHDDREAAELAHLPFARRAAGSRVTRLRNFVRGAARLPSRLPLTHALLDAPDARDQIARLIRDRTPDVVVAYCSGMARFAVEAPLAEFPFVLDLVDVDSAKWQAMADESRGPRRWIYAREASTLRSFEGRAATAARATLVVNEREQDLLRDITPEAPIDVVPNGVDVEAFRTGEPPAASQEVVFCGVMDYRPNEEGVLWFAREIWPHVRASVPSAKFRVVGSRPTSAIRTLATADSTIEVTGDVPAVQPHLWRAAVAVAPLRLARGIQNKVLEALAAGLPVVITPAVRDGLPAEALPGCVVAEEPVAFAREVATLLGASPGERRRRAAVDLARLSWTERLRQVEPILRQSHVQ